MFYLHMNNEAQEVINKLPDYYKSRYKTAYNSTNSNEDKTKYFNECISIIKLSNYTIIPPIRLGDKEIIYFPKLYRLIELMKDNIENWTNHYPKASEILDNIICPNYEIDNPFNKDDNLETNNITKLIMNKQYPPGVSSHYYGFKNKDTLKKQVSAQEEIFRHFMTPFINCDIPELAHKINNTTCEELRPFNKNDEGNYKLNKKSIFFLNTNIYQGYNNCIFNKINAHALTVLILDSIFIQTIGANRFKGIEFTLENVESQKLSNEKLSENSIPIVSFSDNDILISYDINKFLKKLQQSNNFIDNNDYTKFLEEKYQRLTRYDTDEYREYYNTEKKE